MPVVALQSALLAQSVPMFVKPVRSVLQTCGCAPLQRVSPTLHAGAVQAPVVALQSAAVAQALPLFVQPVRSELQTWGCVPLQR